MLQIIFKFPATFKIVPFYPKEFFSFTRFLMPSSQQCLDPARFGLGQVLPLFPSLQENYLSYFVRLTCSRLVSLQLLALILQLQFTDPSTSAPKPVCEGAQEHRRHCAAFQNCSRQFARSRAQCSNVGIYLQKFLVATWRSPTKSRKVSESRIRAQKHMARGAKHQNSINNVT